MDPQEQINIQDTTPRPFKEIPGLWLQFTQMTEDFFRQELRYASPSNTLYSILILSGIVAIFSFISSLISGFLEYPGIADTIGQTEFYALTGGVSFFTMCCGFFLTPVSFYLHNGITLLGARMLGGKGEFSAQAYLSSLYYVPLVILSSVASLLGGIPYAGTCLVTVIAVGVLIFQLMLSVRSLKVVHDLSSGRAFAALLLIPGVFILISLCIIIVLALMGPAIGDVLSNIITELGTPVP